MNLHRQYERKTYPLSTLPQSCDRPSPVTTAIASHVYAHVITSITSHALSQVDYLLSRMLWLAYGVSVNSDMPPVVHFVNQ
jgi:hypothetical protein